MVNHWLINVAYFKMLQIKKMIFYKLDIWKHKLGPLGLSIKDILVNLYAIVVEMSCKGKKT